MLTLDVEGFTLELQDGVVKNVGPATTAATVKLYDVAASEARPFGDRQVKLSFEDDEGNEVEVALGAEAARDLARAVEAMEVTE